MDALLNSLGYVGYAVAVVSGISAFLFRDRYRTLINDIYKPGNQELREQLFSERETTTNLKAENAAQKAAAKEKERYISQLEALNQRLPDFTKLLQSQTALASQVSDNHTVVMGALTSLASDMINSDKEQK